VIPPRPAPPPTRESHVPSSLTSHTPSSLPPVAPSQSTPMFGSSASAADPTAEVWRSRFLLLDLMGLTQFC
jgi:hypothetical protein